MRCDATGREREKERGRDRETRSFSNRGGTEGVNVTRVCVACSTGNTIYTMQIKRARAVVARDSSFVRLPLRFDVLLLMFLLLQRIYRS